MPICMQQVQDYLDNHLVVRNAGSMESLMEVLHDAYMCHNQEDSVMLREKFTLLRRSLPDISPQRFDEIFSLVCDLCYCQEVLAFSQGVAVGMNLMTEVNRLP